MTRICRRLCFLVTLTVVMLGLSNPALTQWIRTPGPRGHGGEIYSMLVEGSTIYAAASTNLFKTTDDGESWVNITPALPNQWFHANATVHSIAAMGGRMFVQRIGVLTSTDVGATWTPSFIFPSTIVQEIAASGSRVYAWATGSAVRSSDAGQTWQPFDSLSSLMAVCAEDSIELLETSNGLFRSVDTGQTYLKVRAVSSVMRTGCTVISGDLAFMGYDNYLFRSMDRGLTWSPDSVTFSGRSLNTVLIAPSGAGPRYVFAGSDSGLYRSSDNGQTWTLKTSGLLSTCTFSLALKGGTNGDPLAILAGTNNGIYRSTDNGENWIEIGTPVGNWILGSTGGKLYAGASSPVYEAFPKYTSYAYGLWRQEIYRTTDGGYSWIEMDTTMLRSVYFYLTSLIAVGTPPAATLYAGLRSTKSTLLGEVIASHPGSTTWTEIPGDTAIHAGVWALASDASDILAATPSGVYRSLDAGITWTNTDSVCAETITSDGSTLYAGGGTLQGGRPMRWVNDLRLTANSGSSWMPIQSSFMSGSSSSFSVPDIICMYASGTDLVVGTQSLAYRNNPDYGPLPPPGGGVYHLVYDGAQWACRDSALSGTRVFALAGAGSRVFAGTNRGIYCSSDNGSTWSGFNDGLRDSVVTSMIICDSMLYAAVSSGVWRRPLSEAPLTGVEAFDHVLPRVCSLAQNYPNPFNPTTTIQYTVAGIRGHLPAGQPASGLAGQAGASGASEVRIVIYDVLGRNVAVLVDEKKAPGTYVAKFDAGNLASGVYFCRMRSENFVDTKKLLLTK